MGAVDAGTGPGLAAGEGSTPMGAVVTAGGVESHVVLAGRSVIGPMTDFATSGGPQMGQEGGHSGRSVIAPMGDSATSGWPQEVREISR